MSRPAVILVKTDAELTFRGITLRGDVLHVPESHQLVIATDEGDEVLTTETPESEDMRAAIAAQRADPNRIVTVKDYSEHSGLVEALQKVGVLKILHYYATGPFAAPVAVAEVL